MRPTEQQTAIVDYGVQGRDMKVEALAGSGKTSTMVMLGEALAPRRGLYLAFNKAIAQEAQRKFPSSVRACTVHSLAFRQVGKHYAHRIEGGDAGRLTPMRLVHHYHYSSLGGITPLTRAGLVKSAVSTYLNSDDLEVESKHLPWAELTRISFARQWSPADVDAVGEALISDARRLWSDMLSEHSGLPMSHDGYLRLFVDSSPDLGVDFITLDEAQDASDSMVRLLTGQSSQKVLVGDRSQQIYGWRGAVDVMQRLDMHTMYLSQSFRFDNRIAGAANEVLRHLQSPVLMRGTEADRSGLAGRALLYRTNAGVFGALMSRGIGRHRQKAYVEGGVGDLRKMLDAVEQLQRGQPTMQPDFIGFADWDEVQEAAESYGAPPELKLVVKVVEKYPMTKLRSVLQDADRVREGEADVVISTAHKAKGREWAEVGIGDDFQLPEKNPLTEESPMNPEESRLNYVALTRAQRQLYGAKEMVTSYLARNKVESQLSEINALPAAERVSRKLGLAPGVSSSPDRLEKFLAHLDDEEREAFGGTAKTMLRRTAPAPGL